MSEQNTRQLSAYCLKNCAVYAHRGACPLEEGEVCDVQAGDEYYNQLELIYSRCKKSNQCLLIDLRILHNCPKLENENNPCDLLNELLGAGPARDMAFFASQ